jgi:hypothetical protein
MQFRGVATEETCAESGTQYAGLKPAESGTPSPLDPAHCMRTEHVPTEHVYFPLLLSKRLRAREPTTQKPTLLKFSKKGGLPMKKGRGSR